MRNPCIMFAALLGLSGLLSAAVFQVAPESPPEEPTPLTGRAKLEQQFKDMLSGAELVGQFTLDGAPADAPLREERYTIAAVTKVRDNIWRFDCRVRYGDTDVTVPIPIRVSWAGDTPMVGLTKQNIPGLGTYSARVLFHEDKYAGTWSGPGYGGHLFGTIERPEPANAP